MGDALAMVLLESRGFTEEDFSKFHPGGALGRALLTKVSDIMRTNDSLAVIKINNTVEDALSQMSKARAGACIITNEDGSMAGIFTHGDFARAFQQDQSIGKLSVSHFMSTDPVTLQSESRAVEAVTTIGSNQVDDIVVLDTADKPVGLIDTQDLSRLKLI